jgi:hypothetical protein
MKMKKTSVVLVLSFLVLASVARAGEVREAFRNGSGDWIVELDNGSFYWGSESSLQELDLSWESKSQQLRDLTLSGAQVEISSEQAEVSCGEGSISDYARVTKEELTRIRERLAIGHVRLKGLPSVWDPAYVLHDAKSGDYFYVATPRYNFHGDYVVFRGKPGKMRKVETLAKSDEVGLIRFKKGGGIYIPSTIDLFKAHLNKGEQPMLLESARGKMQPLTVPRLSGGELARLGVRKPLELKAPRLPSPCDSLLRSAVAKSAPGDGT